jgi:hypothetical protein
MHTVWPISACFAESFGGFEVHRDQLRNAPFGHGHAEQPVHPRHGDRIVGNDHKPGFRPARHLVQKIAVTLHIGIVERSIDLVEDADRRRIRQEYGEDQCHCRQGLLASGQKRHGLRFLARRAGNDFQTGIERIVGIDQLQLRGAAAEQMGEKALEVIIDHLKGCQQPFPRFPVQVRDTGPEAANRLDQVIAFIGQRGLLLVDFGEFFFRAQVDAAEPFPLRP